jgi:hypothetical protein
MDDNKLIAIIVVCFAIVYTIGIIANAFSSCN